MDTLLWGVLLAMLHGESYSHVYRGSADVIVECAIFSDIMATMGRGGMRVILLLCQ